MSHRLTRIAVAALAAVAIAPASAQAAKTPTSKDVARHVEKAMKSTDSLERLVDRGKDRKAVSRLKHSRRTGANAARSARRYAARARSHTAQERAIGALAAAGALQAQNITDYAGLVAEADGTLQRRLAQGLRPTLASRDAVIASLQSLVDRIEDEELKAIAAQALAALTAQAPAAIEALATLDVEALPQRISELVTTAMEMATAALDHVTTELGTLIPSLPSAAQEPVAQALATVTTVLAGLTPMVEQMNATIVATIDGVMSMVNELLATIPGVSGILGGFAGGDTAGDDSTAPGGLLGGLDGLIPDLGGIPVVGGLLDSILGNLPIIGGLR